MVERVPELARHPTHNLVDPPRRVDAAHPFHQRAMLVVDRADFLAGLRSIGSGRRIRKREHTIHLRRARVQHVLVPDEHARHARVVRVPEVVELEPFRRLGHERSAAALRVREEALPFAVPVAPPEVVAQDVVARVPREAHDSRKAVAEPTRAVVLPAFLMVFRDGWEMRLQEHGRAAQW